MCGIGKISKELVDGAENRSDATQGVWFESKADFLAAMGEIIKEGDNILVKASHGMQFTEIVEALQTF